VDTPFNNNVIIPGAIALIGSNVLTIDASYGIHTSVGLFNFPPIPPINKDILITALRYEVTILGPGFDPDRTRVRCGITDGEDSALVLPSPPIGQDCIYDRVSGLTSPVILAPQNYLFIAEIIGDDASGTLIQLWVHVNGWAIDAGSTEGETRWAATPYDVFHTPWPPTPSL